MSFGSSLDAKEQIRQAIDIVELVGRYIQLRRQGRNFVGLCPWHDDSRPSLQVNPERQSFKCWVCNLGGDIFSFIMKMEGIPFPEALNMLAEQAGIQFKPERTTGSNIAGGSSAGSKRLLFQAMAWAEQQYHECLVRLPEGEPGRKYLAERRIAAQSVEKFHLGYSPEDWDWIIRRAKGTPYNPKVLESIGLLARSAEGGRAFDRFRGRVLFSIRDAQDRPVGVGGRVLPGSSSQAKYINSPETPLFTKSKLLYGLDLAKHAMRKTRTALVMEGYTDCIAAHECGFADAVAVLGTALGEEHIRTLRHYVDRIVLVLDGDEAGQRRAREVLELFVAQQVDLQIVTIPDDLDPCDFLHDHGAEAFRELIASRAVDALDHAFLVHTAGIDLERDVHRASQALERLVAILAKAPRLRADTSRDARFREEKVLQRLAASFRIPEADVRNRLTELRRATMRRPARGGPDRAAEPPAPAVPIDAFQRELLEILVRHPECLGAVRGEISPEMLEHGPCRRVYEMCCRLADMGQAADFSRLMLEFNDPNIQNLLVEVDDAGLAKGAADPDALIKEWLKGFKNREASRRVPVEAGMLRQRRLDEHEELDVLKRILQQERARHGIADPMEG